MNTASIVMLSCRHNGGNGLIRMSIIVVSLKNLVGFVFFRAGFVLISCDDHGGKLPVLNHYKPKKDM